MFVIGKTWKPVVAAPWTPQTPSATSAILAPRQVAAKYTNTAFHAACYLKKWVVLFILIADLQLKLDLSATSAEENSQSSFGFLPPFVRVCGRSLWIVFSQVQNILSERAAREFLPRSEVEVLLWRNPSWSSACGGEEEEEITTWLIYIQCYKYKLHLW